MQTKFNQIMQYLDTHSNERQEYLKDNAVTINIGNDRFDVGFKFDFFDSDKQIVHYCTLCQFFVFKNIKSTNTYESLKCIWAQPQVCIYRIFQTVNGENVLSKKIFIDGDSIQVDYIEFDLMFYIKCVKLFISSESELITYLKLFDKSFSCNKWYINANGAWLNRLISESKFGSVYLKALFGCLEYQDGLTFLESKEINRFGYIPLLKAFKIQYSNTSNSIVSDEEVASKLEEWIPRSEFCNRVETIFIETINNFKSRKRTYFDFEKKQVCINDGSFEAKKRIYFSGFSSYPEFEAKRIIIKKWIRKAENEVRILKGFNIVGSLVNESLLYQKIKEHFASYNVVSQYRPKWLGRQSLDIFIHDLNIAIEYQGDQHSKPVEFYGGVKGFEKTQQRDKVKFDRCKRNGCKLLYVYPNYKFEVVLEEIYTLAKK